MFVFYHVRLSQKRTTFAKGDKKQAEAVCFTLCAVIARTLYTSHSNQAKHLDWFGHLHYLFTQV